MYNIPRKYLLKNPLRRFKNNYFHRKLTMMKHYSPLHSFNRIAFFVNDIRMLTRLLVAGYWRQICAQDRRG